MSIEELQETLEEMLKVREDLLQMLVEHNEKQALDEVMLQLIKVQVSIVMLKEFCEPNEK